MFATTTHIKIETIQIREAFQILAFKGLLPGWVKKLSVLTLKNALIWYA